MASSGKPDVPWVLMGRTVNLDPGSNDAEIPQAAALDLQEDELLMVSPSCISLRSPGCLHASLG